LNQPHTTQLGTKGKPTRLKGKCTGCGTWLPESILGWGLKWDDGAGFCAKCLYDIRQSIGYFEPEEVARRKERKKREARLARAKKIRAKREGE
jgi:hypothetical protein